MRNHIRLIVNGQLHRVSGEDALLSLSTFLRSCLGLTGTKIVCSEGDCGSCSVLQGVRAGNQFQYQPVDSCIRFVFQLDGVHIVTVEGLMGPPSPIHHAQVELSNVQHQLVDCHGSQCGFCTPGFAVAMTGLMQGRETICESDIRSGLTGNLCRCTGYSPIIAACQNSSSDSHDSLNVLYPCDELQTQLQPGADDSIEIRYDQNGKTRRLFCPANLINALQRLDQYPDAVVVAGATDIGVQVNKSGRTADTWIDLNKVDELRSLEVTDTHVMAGAGAAWTQLEAIAEHSLPEFHRMIARFGAPQIRHVGTLGGNIINASPIADSLPFLYVMEAELELRNLQQSRWVNINDFYRGYKQLDLQPGELLTRIRVPLASPQKHLRIYKISRRWDLDISSFTAAIWIELVDGQIADAGVAYGAVGPTVIRMQQTEAALRGQPFAFTTFQQAGSIAVHEISPISDVRGSDQYRLTLAQNILLKFYHEVANQLPTAGTAVN